MNIKAFKKKIRRIFFPLRCELCGEIVPLEKERCFCYEEEIKRTAERLCEFCGLSEESCMCSEGEIRLSHFTAPFVYRGFIKKYIHAFKFDGKKSYAKALGEEMSKKLISVYPNVKFDAVTFVPLSESALKERGFNQSELLAREVSLRLNLPVESVLKKVSETKKQHSLTAKERKTNLKNAFGVQNEVSVKGKTYILCDDIKTTGSTLKFTTEVLLEKGAKDVYCLSAAVSDYEKLPF